VKFSDLSKTSSVSNSVLAAFRSVTVATDCAEILNFLYIMELVTDQCSV